MHTRISPRAGSLTEWAVDVSTQPLAAPRWALLVLVPPESLSTSVSLLALGGQIRGLPLLTQTSQPDAWELELEPVRDRTR